MAEIKGLSPAIFHFNDFATARRMRGRLDGLAGASANGLCTGVLWPGTSIAMTDTKTQRLNMVESQVRPSDVTDRRLIRAMGEVARETFVPAHLASVAYMDSPVALVSDAAGRPLRELLPPRTFAKLAQAADLSADAVVLDAGCGTGYSTAVLAKVVRRVVGLEADQGLADKARTSLTSAGVTNAIIVHGALANGHAGESPFDIIVLEGAVSEVPRSLLDQLKDGGRLVAIVGTRANGKAVVWTRSGATYGQRDVFDATAATLPGFERASAFAL
jgi:protein-L-isoaspartate(D-aspartate) O-methyltransferase